MKLTAQFTRFFAVLFALPALGRAHPGHGAFDWFSGLPHAGHASEYAIVLNVLAVLILAAGIYWLGSRER